MAIELRANRLLSADQIDPQAEIAGGRECAVNRTRGRVIATSAGYLKATVGLGVLVQSAGGVLIVAAAVTAAIGKFAQTRTARA